MNKKAHLYTALTGTVRMHEPLEWSATYPVGWALEVQRQLKRGITPAPATPRERIADAALAAQSSRIGGERDRA